MALSKKALAFIIIGGIIALGAAVTNVILIVKLLEQWKILLSATVLTGAAVGIGAGIINYLKGAAAKATTSSDTVTPPTTPTA
jgi:hypothetical protein